MNNLDNSFLISYIYVYILRCIIMFLYLNFIKIIYMKNMKIDITIKLKYNFEDRIWMDVLLCNIYSNGNQYWSWNWSNLTCRTMPWGLWYISPSLLSFIALANTSSSCSWYQIKSNLIFISYKLHPLILTIIIMMVVIIMLL